MNDFKPFTVSNDRSASAISAIAIEIMQIISHFHCINKLIGQTQDGAAVMAGHLNGVQAKIKEKNSEAMLMSIIML